MALHKYTNIVFSYMAIIVLCQCTFIVKLSFIRVWLVQDSRLKRPRHP